MMLLKPRLNLFVGMYGRTIILIYGIAWQKYAKNSKNIIIEYTEIFIRNNPVTWMGGPAKLGNIVAQIISESWLLNWVRKACFGILHT